MRSLPEDLEAGAMVDALAEGWDFHAETAEYAPVGGGSYHWVVTDPKGPRGFVTVDDLDTKPWLGVTRDRVLAGLERAYDAAIALREQGLAFVVAPIPSRLGGTVRRIGDRYIVALFPFLDGQPGAFGRYEAAERAAILPMLADLHAKTSGVDALVARIDLDLPGRQWLESALNEVDRPWSGGPLSEEARGELARHASDVTGLLGLFARLSADVESSSSDWVVTHGEPHGGNVMRTANGYALIDWDTVALAPRERDLWMLLGDGEEDATVYTAATGHRPEQSAMDYFRLRWHLADIAAFTHDLRSPHRVGDDTVRALDNLRSLLAVGDRWAQMFGDSGRLSSNGMDAEGATS